MTTLQYQLAHSINGFRNNNWFWTTITKFILEWTTTLVEFRIPSINTGPCWSFIIKNFNSIHRSTVVELIHVESCKKYSLENVHDLITFFVRNESFKLLQTTQLALVYQNVLSTYNLKNVKLYDRAISWQIATLWLPNPEI